MTHPGTTSDDRRRVHYSYAERVEVATKHYVRVSVAGGVTFDCRLEAAPRAGDPVTVRIEWGEP